MYALHSRNNWTYQEGPDPTIDFCLQVLQLDGLHVPPFDQHPDGDGSLRALGLTAEAWQDWFLRVLDRTRSELDIEKLRQQRFSDYMKEAGETDLEHFKQRYRNEQLGISSDPPLPPQPAFHHLHVSWHGNVAIANRLLSLQEQQVFTQQDAVCHALQGAWQREEHRSGTRLYDELKAYSTRLPPLRIYLTSTYEYPLDYIVPPATLIMTIQEGQPDYQEHHERVLTAVAELVASSRQRGKSQYTRIQVRAGQTSPAYRLHTRQPIPPRPAEPEMPTFADPARQAVVEALANEHSHVIYGPVDFASLQFLREKNNPGWKLYQVSFQDTDGEQHYSLYILQQNADGTWESNGGGRIDDPQKQWPDMVAPIHDHPLLSLTWHAAQFDDQSYLLTSHGTVTANGFSVERVRLVNEAGQILEDVVEDDMVFFPCTIQERIQLPMQAELYDPAGKLLWRQRVPDDELPPWYRWKPQDR